MDDGERVTLRPVRESDLGMLEALTNDPDTAGEYQWFGWHDPGFVRRRWQEDGMLGSDRGMLVPALGGRALGLVSWHRSRTGPSSFCWNVGLVLLPEARGHGHGTEAQRQLVRYLFAHTQLNRVEATTETGNRAEQRSLEKAGFTREGVLRGFDFRDGEWRDNVLYSVVRSDLSNPL
ncbi:GNAT family N-acetyltransferase [Amycolatopsis saalfeldensis]|uniref:Protein N-acetyltransferase, RimJ/RimL family n=1 Tax=Amycolatopsis saalfeldensis TaxID=394193 RepID=A0A1H8X3R1_9PSEU|nr:GNAT family protein [Amycolatopsis saalfeldensis]SEP34544.1 Protein N-acetyltransferase, RimJ/RimL family [Amycolatopsis saalfeldensis]